MAPVLSVFKGVAALLFPHPKYMNTDLTDVDYICPQGDPKNGIRSDLGKLGRLILGVTKNSNGGWSMRAQQYRDCYVADVAFGPNVVAFRNDLRKKMCDEDGAPSVQTLCQEFRSSISDWRGFRDGALNDLQADLLVLLQREMDRMAGQEAITPEHIELVSAMCEACQVATPSNLKSLGQMLKVCCLSVLASVPLGVLPRVLRVGRNAAGVETHRVYRMGSCPHPGPRATSLTHLRAVTLPSLRCRLTASLA